MQHVPFYVWVAPSLCITCGVGSQGFLRPSASARWNLTPANAANNQLIRNYGDHAPAEVCIHTDTQHCTPTHLHSWTHDQSSLCNIESQSTIHTNPSFYFYCPMQCLIFHNIYRVLWSFIKCSYLINISLTRDKSAFYKKTTTTKCVMKGMEEIIIKISWLIRNLPNR